MNTEECGLEKPTTTKKKTLTGRVRDATKKLRLQSHVAGPDCKCVRLKCFEKIPLEERTRIIQDFNLMESWNAQSAYLTGLISLCSVSQRRPRRSEEESNLKSSSFFYKIRVMRSDVATEVQVCKKAFISLHGLTGRRIETIQNSMQMSGNAPVDKRGKHLNRKHKFSDAVKTLIFKHIKSFKGRSSHYSIRKSKKVYLPAELNVKKMHQMFKDLYPEVNVSYESYRHIFCTKFNIAFGYPRSDTCSTCDKFKVQIDACQNKVDETNKLQVAQKLHLSRAGVFYARKRKARLESQQNADVEALCIDYGRNLSMPNITTNDVYYSRQLSLFTFIAHRLSDSEVLFYSYPENVGRKGANEVSSFFFDYTTYKLSTEVKHLKVFCDSCAGQNKNYIFFNFLHYLVHHHPMSKLESITVTFPIRGHSYMECDKDMGLLNGKFRAEVPEDWFRHIENARLKPAPFKVEKVDRFLIRNWREFLSVMYLKKCPFQTRPIKELRVDKKHPRLLFHRDTYNGAWESSVIIPPKRKRITGPPIPNGQFYHPPAAYADDLPISAAKWKDLRKLQQFCTPEAQRFLELLKHL